MDGTGFFGTEQKDVYGFTNIAKPRAGWKCDERLLFGQAVH